LASQEQDGAGLREADLVVVRDIALYVDRIQDSQLDDGLDSDAGCVPTLELNAAPQAQNNANGRTVNSSPPLDLLHFSAAASLSQVSTIPYFPADIEPFDGGVQSLFRKVVWIPA
jgi:hypothetical protein